MKVQTDLNLIQHAFNKLSTFFTLSKMLDDLFKHPQHLVQQSVGRMLNQMLKPFKRALRLTPAVRKILLQILVNFAMASCDNIVIVQTEIVDL